ncbi:MAG TPA: helix-turn-helix domain-containing protein [Polyangiaceae bacterium]|nr:helix-turn-helix domain-containing protein [Polyangiaceae bacterium]
MRHARLAELYRLVASEHERLAKESDDEYVDQRHSPLGPRRHCELVRTGELPGYRGSRKRILVRRADIDSYLERNRILPTETKSAPESFEEVLANYQRAH